MKYGYWFQILNDDHDVLPEVNEPLLAQSCDSVFFDSLEYADSTPKSRKQMLEALNEGDLVVVPTLSRFAHDMEDLLACMDLLLKRKAAFRALDWGGTEAYSGSMFPEVLSAALAFQTTVYRAQAQREEQAVRLRGRNGGRPKVDDATLRKALRLYDRNKLSIQEITERTGVSKSTLYKYLSKRRQNSEESSQP